MNFRVLLSILGIFLVIFSGFLLAFYFIALFIYPEEGQSTSFLLSFLLTLISGLICYFSVGKFNEDDVTYREGFAVVGLIWIIIAFFGALPAYFSGNIPSITDAYFESMSGFTTTGASILTDIEAMGKTILLWRSFSHWLGGMGFIVLSLAILPALGVGGMQLYIAEVPGPSPDKLVPRISQTARILYFVYSLFTVIQIALLYFNGMSFFDSLCHTFGTMGTGGFSPLNSSIGQYASQGNPNALIYEIIIIVFMFLAGANFSLHYKALKGDFSVYLKDPEFKFYLAITLIAILGIGVDLYRHNNYSHSSEILRHSTFTVVSIITTTGYSTQDFDRWPDFSRFFIVLISFIGGCAGSTGGGIKVMRILTIIKQSISELSRTIHPKKIHVIRFGRVYISKDVLYSMNTFIILYIFFYVTGIILLSFTGLDLVTISSMVVACFSNVGPGLGQVGPSHNFGFLPDYAKWILSYMMVLGRLEILPVLVLSLPGTWSK